MNYLDKLGELPVHQLKGINETTTEALAKLNIHTMLDLLLHLPMRYQDRINQVPVKGLQAGQEGVVKGTLVSVRRLRSRKNMLHCKLQDETGAINLLFFHVRRAQLNTLSTGTKLRCFGMVRNGFNGLEMAQPEYRLATAQLPNVQEATLTPVYRRVKNLSQQRLCNLIRQVLSTFDANAKDSTDGLFRSSGLPGRAASFHLLHKPPSGTSLRLLNSRRLREHQRLAWEELLAQLLVTMRLQDIRLSCQATSLQPEEQRITDFLARLPFRPTAAQQKAITKLLAELRRSQPMMQLLQGDVGSGKTLVATVALLAAVETGQQATLMVPTEILAQQHFQTLTQWSLPAMVLTGRTTRKQRNLVLDRIGSGEPCIVIGTHALFQEDVKFTNLALVVIDEQHKFGVHQRLALQEKGQQPHQLIMTATPIPRTLAMSLYTDLQISVLDEMPKGRQSVITAAIPKERSTEVMDRIKIACQKGAQVYWICPFIEASEEAEEVASAAEVARELTGYLPELRVGVLHGRLKSAAKEALITSFHGGELDILVATTIVEVGIDIPNATIMVIDSADRLGLAQMHQLRGRVGRGQKTSYCLLLYTSPLTKNSDKRLRIIRETTDGFQIAERDLALRGAGELLGSQQTGRFAMRVADLMAEARHLPRLRQIAQITKQGALADIIIRRWLPESERTGLA